MLSRLDLVSDSPNHISKLPSWSLGQYSKWNPGWKLRKSSLSWKQISQRFPRFTSLINQGKTSSPQSQCARPGTIRKLVESKSRQKVDTRGHFWGDYNGWNWFDWVAALQRPNSFLILAQPCQPCLVTPQFSCHITNAIIYSSKTWSR